MESKFKTGDKVQLISGGPAMTVSEYVGNDQIQCDWFDKSTRCSETFKEDQLTLYKAPRRGSKLVTYGVA